MAGSALLGETRSIQLLSQFLDADQRPSYPRARLAFASEPGNCIRRGRHESIRHALALINDPYLEDLCLDYANAYEGEPTECSVMSLAFSALMSILLIALWWNMPDGINASGRTEITLLAGVAPAIFMCLLLVLGRGWWLRRGFAGREARYVPAKGSLLRAVLAASMNDPDDDLLA